ncbi:MAG TPA: ParB/RepB/Spo0J family partition protein [Vitreimonas sp.]|nr:ParB/RepB/Spo0J family partition protein [Vitreimonas sp.]
MADSVQFLSISLIQPNPFQPRSTFDKEAIEELKQSIVAYGVLEPLVIAHTPAGYQIIAGERRWRAAREAGLEEVPVIIKKTTPKGMLEMALVENVQRVDLQPMERAQAFRQLMRDFGFTISQLASKIGKSSAYISNSIRLLDLPDAIKDGLVGNMITEGHARALAGIPDEKQMIECYKIILRESASVRRAEELSRRFRETSEDKLSEKGRPKPLNDAQLRQWQKKFQELFHAKTQFKLVRSTRQTRVSFTMRGTPEETQADLEKILAFAELSPAEGNQE